MGEITRESLERLYVRCLVDRAARAGAFEIVGSDFDNEVAAMVVARAALAMTPGDYEEFADTLYRLVSDALRDEQEQEGTTDE